MARRSAKRGADEQEVTRREFGELLALHEQLKQLEYLEARDNLAIYCGLHIPAEIERDDDDVDKALAGLEKLPRPARYIPAQHHRLLIDKLEALERGYVVENGETIPFKRLMVFMPPGSAKSTYCSVMFPAWYLGRNPRKCVIQGSYGAKLAGRFGRRARKTYSSREHQAVFGIGLGKSAENNWETEHGGEYAAFGMESGITGYRADLAIIDDAIKGRREADSKTERDNVWETYRADVRTRMRPRGAIVYVATRWHEDDPAGRILPKEAIGKSGWFTAKDGERWYVISLKAIIESKQDAADDPLHRKVGEILWPEWFVKEEFEQERRSQGQRNWNALFRQMPRPDEGAVLKRQFWRKWPNEKPPKCEYVMSVYDTAFEEHETADYTARTTWGVFYHEEPPPDETGEKRRWAGGRHCCILLEAYEDRVEFPELRKLAKKHYTEFRPDRIMVEKKASGHSLIQELRRAGVPVKAVKADISKLARAHAAAVILEDGCVWYMDRSWARDVIDKCASATFLKKDPGNDTPDTCVHAWLLLRRMFHLNLKDDPDDDDVQTHDEPSFPLFGR